MPEKKIKILHLISGLNVGGAEMSLYNLLMRLDPMKFSNAVLVMGEIGPVGCMLVDAGISVESLAMKRGAVSLRSLPRLISAIRKHKPDILQTWMYHADLAGALFGRMSGASHLVWNVRCSDMDFSNTSRLTAVVRRSCALLSKLPDAIVFNSQAGRKFHEQLGYRNARHLVISNGVDVERFQPDPKARDEIRRELGIDSETVLIGMVARLDPMKDHENFFRAARIFLTEHPRARFLLCGEGTELAKEKMGALFDDSVFVSKFLFLGARRDIEKIFAALDIATLSSAYGEGFPNVVCEAMACGVPCVVTDVGDSRMIVGDAGLIVEPRDSLALANSWYIALGAREVLGKKSRERVVGCYSHHKMIEAYGGLYENFVS